MKNAAICAGVAAIGAALYLFRRERSTVAPDVTALIGNTPLVRLNALSAHTQCEIYAKLELANPGGSAKDRIALAIVEEAERANELRPGHRDCVFEGTSGSTGISIALICRARGYAAHIVVPSDTSADKQALLRMLGAHLHLVAPAGIADPQHYVNVARSLAHAMNERFASGEVATKAVFANQFENEANWRAHLASTGPEIWQQAPQIDCFVSGAGTGGTIAGVSQFLKRRKPSVRIALADVPGSGLYNRVHYGVMYNQTEREGTRRRHQVDTIVEGIGLNRVTANLRAAQIDDAELVSDDDARYMARHLVEHEGLFVGSSSGVTATAAFRQARKLGPGHTVVLILCDSGQRHVSKFWKREVNEDCALSRELGR